MRWSERSLLVVWLLHRCWGLYDPVHHIESARIYGNIDSFAYYYVDLLVGTPPQRVSVIVDTGSGVTAFPCRSCRHCGNHIDPAFDFSSSPSAHWKQCGNGCATGCRDGHCGYHQGYTEGSSISGWWFEDMVRLGDTIQKNPAVRSTMGCHQDENRLFYTQKANGIMGIRPPGRGAPTLLQQLFADKAHVDTQVFSLCLAEWGGRMVVGGFNASYHKGPINYVPLNTRTGYYGVPLTGMTVAGSQVRGKFGTAMIDSGTTYTYMATEPYRSLRSGIEGHCKQAGCGGTQRGNCWEIPGGREGLSKFPTITVHFESVKTLWTPTAYLYRKGNSNRFCYGFEDDGARANTVLGAAWMLEQEIIFDLKRSRVGIAQANCPTFRKRPDHNKNADMTLPTAAPAALPAAAPAADAAPGEGSNRGTSAEPAAAAASAAGSEPDSDLGVVLTLTPKEPNNGSGASAGTPAAAAEASAAAAPAEPAAPAPVPEESGSVAEPGDANDASEGGPLPADPMDLIPAALRARVWKAVGGLSGMVLIAGCGAATFLCCCVYCCCCKGSSEDQARKVDFERESRQARGGQGAQKVGVTYDPDADDGEEDPLVAAVQGHARDPDFFDQMQLRPAE